MTAGDGGTGGVRASAIVGSGAMVVVTTCRT